jgi:hypothetical protein
LKRIALSSFCFFLFLALSRGDAAFGNPLSLAKPDAPQTPRRGDGDVAFSVLGTFSKDFFDSSGTRRDSSDPTFPSGAQEHFVDLTFLMSAMYGLTDNLTLWLDFPLMYRNESLAYDTSDFGLSDIRAGAVYRVLGRNTPAFEAAFGVAGRFPSGTTNVGYSNPATGDKLQLPLGTGTLDLTPLLLFKWHPARGFSWNADIAYTFRFAAVVEYLQSPTIPQASAGDPQTTVNLPVGNLKIDWGDELNLGTRWAYTLSEWNTIAVGADYLYRRPTSIRNFNFTVNGSSFSSAVDDLVSGSAALLTVTPAWTVHLNRNTSVRVAARIPVWGKSYPTLPLLESLVGISGEVGVSHAF